MLGLLWRFWLGGKRLPTPTRAPVERRDAGATVLRAATQGATRLDNELPVSHADRVAVQTASSRPAAPAAPTDPVVRPAEMQPGPVRSPRRRVTRPG